MSDEDQLVLFVTGGCGLLLMGFLLLAYSRNRNARLRQESMERSLEYQKLITEATKGLYESIYEVDVTRDRADSEETRHYFERLGISGDTPFGEACGISRPRSSGRRTAGAIWPPFLRTGFCGPTARACAACAMNS